MKDATSWILNVLFRQFNREIPNTPVFPRGRKLLDGQNEV